MDPIKSGFIARNFVFGIILVLLGCGIVVADNMVSFPMEFKGYIIPWWSVYVLSVLFFVCGIMLVAGSGRADICSSCRRRLVLDKAVFALQDGDKIVHAVLELDASQLKELRRLREGEARVVLMLDYCHACRRVAKITVRKEDKRRSTELVSERTVTGPPVWKFIDEIEKLKELRAKQEVIKETEYKRREL